MIQIRKAAERGTTRVSWLDSRHTFSFNRYFDPRWTGFGALLVINDDRVTPGGGFPTHGHREMEILTWVLEGAIEHADSAGHGSVLGVGEIQRMSAGRGITHSEFNHHRDQPLRFLQIWITPAERGLAPGYEQKAFDPSELEGKLRLVASPDGDNGAVRVHQDARTYVARLAPGQRIEHVLEKGRRAWAQIATGEAIVNGERLEEGDGIALADEPGVTIEARSRSEIMLFDLP